jgi:hypothetical protein
LRVPFFKCSPFLIVTQDKQKKHVTMREYEDEDKRIHHWLFGLHDDELQH